MLFDIVNKFALYSLKEKKIQLFYNFNNELNNIFLGRKDQIAVMLRLSWWKERLEEIVLHTQGNYNPLLLDIKAELNTKEIKALQEIVDLQLLKAEIERFDSPKDTIDQYLAPLTQAKASLMNVDIPLITSCILEYIETHPNTYDIVFLNELFELAKNTHNQSKYNRDSNLIKIYYKSSQILISKYNSLSGDFNITPTYFRILLGLKLL